MNKIAVMGAGAVGCYFGGMLARGGFDVTLIARGAQAEALARSGLDLESIQFRERIAVHAATSPAAAQGADLVLFCVKTRDTEVASKALGPHVSRGAVVVSLQNGVDNLERMHAAAGLDALASVVYVAASVPEPGHVKHVGRGDLILGDPLRKDDVARVAAAFERAGVPCRVTGNIEGELWRKLVANCAGNAVSALAHSSYGRAWALEPARETMMAAALEAVEVARAAGVELPPGDLVAYAMDLIGKFGPASSSTRQDIENHRPTEIEALNGYIARRGRELGVPTPVNHTLFALVKLLEEGFQQSASQASS